MAYMSITRALSQAGLQLLNRLIEFAQERGDETDDAVFTAIEHWAREVLHAADLTAIFNAAQDEFTAAPGANSRWLDTFAVLFEHGSDGIAAFAENLWRTYFFRLEEAPEALWSQYPELQRAVTLNTECNLPRSWGDWVLPIEILMSIAEARLIDATEAFECLLVSQDVVEMLAELALGEEIPAPSSEAHAPSMPPDANTALMAYLSACINTIGLIDPRGLPQVGRAPVSLETVFTPLRLVPFDAYHQPVKAVRYRTATFISADLFAFKEALGPGELEAHPGLMPQEVLSRHSQVLVLGDVGAGKTTLLRAIAFEYARILSEDQSDSIQIEMRPDGGFQVTLARPLPIYIDLAEYVDDHLPDESLRDFALRSAAEIAADQSVGPLVSGFLQAGQCVLLLDGLNQVATDEQRRMLVEAVADASAQWHAEGNRVVVTSRLAGYTAAPLPAEFAIHVIRPLDRSQIGPFLLRWTLALIRLKRPLIREDEALQQAQAETLALVREVTTNSQLHALVNTPLMLRLLIGIYRSGMVIAPQRVALYQMVADALIREWRLPQSASARPTILEHEATDLLSHLAFWMHASRASGRLSEQDLQAILVNIWRQLHPDAPIAQGEEAIGEFVSRIRSQPGVLVECGNGQYGFVYDGLQEYFAARYLVSSYRLASERIRALLHDPRWDEIIRLAIGFTALRSQEDASDLIEMAILARGTRAQDMGYSPALFEDLLKRDLFFAARLLGTGIETRSQITHLVVDELVSLWLGGDRDSLGRFSLIFDSARRHLMNLDGALASRRALQLVLEGLNSIDEHRRAFAADALTFWPSHLAEAIDVLVKDGREAPPLARWAAAQALGASTNLSVEAYKLLLSLVCDTDERVNQGARDTLHNVPPVPSEALAMFVDLLRGGNPAGRRVSLRQLQQIGALPPGVINELIYLLNDSDQETRRAAMEALSSANELPENALLTICRFAMDTESGLRLAAIDALRRPVELPQEVLDHLIDWTYDPEVAIRRASALALGECLNDSNEVMEALIERLDDPVDSVRADVVEPLASRGHDDTRVMHVLAHAVRDPTHRVRCAIAAALKHFPCPNAELREALRLLLSDKEVIVRETTLDTIAHLEEPGPELVDYLVSLVSVQDFGIGAKSVCALSRLRGLPNQALVVLVRALSTHWEEHGKSIAACLKVHGPLGMDIINRIMDLAVQRPAGRTYATQVPIGLQVLALEILGHVLDEAPDLGHVLLEVASENGNSQVQIAALCGLRYSREMRPDSKQILLDLTRQGPLQVRCAAGVTLGHLIRNLPDPPFQSTELSRLGETITVLLKELPPRASWENDARLQNELLMALNWIVARARPAPPRLVARLEDSRG
ncbi:MAG: HEAT repeat domain-containing protein [Anaerolineae bacterium]|nr:HEAT repeat domain-containing protein [Anaerolineae bacterium]